MHIVTKAYGVADATFWSDKVLPAVEAQTCCVLIARQEGRIVGTVQFDLATPPNQPHRAEVKKLLVHPEARRGGVARALMLALEKQARSAGRTLLTLDTASMSAERLYSSLGYVRVGVIPRFSFRPDSSELESTTVMYKERRIGFTEAHRLTRRALYSALPLVPVVGSALHRQLRHA